MPPLFSDSLSLSLSAVENVRLPMNGHDASSSTEPLTTDHLTWIYSPIRQLFPLETCLCSHAFTSGLFSVSRVMKLFNTVSKGTELISLFHLLIVCICYHFSASIYCQHLTVYGRLITKLMRSLSWKY